MPFVRKTLVQYFCRSSVVITSSYDSNFSASPVLPWEWHMWSVKHTFLCSVCSILANLSIWVLLWIESNATFKFSTYSYFYISFYIIAWSPVIYWLMFLFFFVNTIVKVVLLWSSSHTAVVPLTNVSFFIDPFSFCWLYSTYLNLIKIPPTVMLESCNYSKYCKGARSWLHLCTLSFVEKEIYYMFVIKRKYVRM